MRSRGPNRRNLRCPAAFAVGLLVLLLASCEETQESALPPPPPKVVTAEVTKQAVPIVLQASGTIKAVKNVEIIPRVSGYIFERYFAEGTFVDKDAPLYLIDPRPFEHELARLQAELKGLQGSRDFWQSETNRYTKLANQDFVSAEKADGARANLRTAEADVAQTEVEIRNAKLDLSYTKVNAPFYGRIQQTRINVGNLVTKEQDVLTSMVALDPIYVIFQLSRSQVFDIQTLKRQGEAFEVGDMVVELVLPDGQLYRNKGELSFVSAEINPTTDSMTIRGTFDNPKNSELGDYDLVPGQYVPVRLTIGNTPDALVIPQAAVVETQAGTHVYVVGPDDKVERRLLELGRIHGTDRIVTKGLKLGEKVVVEGVQKVKSGVEVQPVAPDEDKATGEADKDKAAAGAG